VRSVGGAFRSSRSGAVPTDVAKTGARRRYRVAAAAAADRTFLWFVWVGRLGTTTAAATHNRRILCARFPLRPDDNGNNSNNSNKVPRFVSAVDRGPGFTCATHVNARVFATSHSTAESLVVSDTTNSYDDSSRRTFPANRHDGRPSTKQYVSSENINIAGSCTVTFVSSATRTQFSIVRVRRDTETVGFSGFRRVRWIGFSRVHAMGRTRTNPVMKI